MSPVRQTNPRTMVFAAGTFVLGAVLVLILVVFTVGKASEGGNVEVKLGSDTFDAGDAELRAEAVARDGPILFSDVSGGQRDIYLQHTGEDPKQGWTAFDARRPDQPRSCQLTWNRTTRVFDDSCGGPPVPADGQGLTHYPAVVNEENSVIVDLNADRRGSTTTTAPPPTESSTTTTVRISGAR